MPQSPASANFVLRLSRGFARLVGAVFLLPGRLAGEPPLAALVVLEALEALVEREGIKEGHRRRQGLGAKRGSFVSYKPKSPR